MKVIIALALMLALTTSYETEESGVLVLHDSDFPGIISEFNYILIEFYAPWCGHCQRLAPAYSEAAKAFAEKNSPIKLAKVDATKDGESAKEYGVRGYPTIFFFINGTKISFSGQRSKDGIMRWLEKKILPTTTEVSTEEELAALKDNGSVNLVLFSDNEEAIEKFKTLAVADDNNRYYIAAADLVKRHPETTVEIHRNFGEVLTHPGVEGRFSWWVGKYSRPLIVDFDDRTIGSIFRDQKNAIILFNSLKSEELTSILTTAAGASESELIFSQIAPGQDHFDRFAEFLKVKASSPKFIAILSGDRKKAILAADTITLEGLNAFISQVEDGSARTYSLEEDPETATEAAAEAEPKEDEL